MDTQLPHAVEDALLALVLDANVSTPVTRPQSLIDLILAAFAL